MVMAGRSGLTEGLVGTQVVVVRAEGVESALLAGRVGLDGVKGVLVEGAVEAFEATVLFGVAGLDAFGDDAELEEPDGETGEAAEAVGCEGRAVVGTDDARESALAEDAFEDGANLEECRVEQGLAGEQVS